MEQAESNPDSLRVFTTERWFVQLGMAARGIACCFKCGEIWLLGRQVMANEIKLSVNGTACRKSSRPKYGTIPSERRVPLPSNRVWGVSGECWDILSAPF